MGNPKGGAKKDPLLTVQRRTNLNCPVLITAYGNKKFPTNFPIELSTLILELVEQGYISAFQIVPGVDDLQPIATFTINPYTQNETQARIRINEVVSKLP